MDTEYKLTALKDFRLTEAGAFKALFAPFNVVDKQNDLTLPGAFGQQRVVISAYGHGSWEGRLPVGKGRIYDGPDGGIVEGQFFLNTSGGKDTYTIVKELGDLQEWSYALPEIDFEMGEHEGKKVRILKRIGVNEVSPVLMGAGNGTRTLEVKTMSFDEQYGAAICAIEDLVERLEGRMKSRTSGNHSRPSAADLKRAKEIDARIGELSRKLAARITEWDSLDSAFLRFQAITLERE
jgi:hypothetical protein